MYVCVHTHIETKKLIYYNHSKVKFLISRYNDQKKENGWKKNSSLFRIKALV